MGIAIRNLKGDYSKTAKRILPAVPEGLLLFALYGTSSELSCRNLLGEEAPQLTNRGVDTFGPTFLSTLYTGSKCLSTNIAEPRQGTLIAVAAPRDLVNEVRALSAFGSPRVYDGAPATIAAGVGFAKTANTGELRVKGWCGRTVGGGTDNASHSASVPSAEPLAVGRFYCIASRWGGADRAITVNNLSSGETASAPLNKDQNFDPAQGPFLVGADTGHTNTFDHGASLIYERILSDAELQAAYAQLKGYFARRGVAI